MSTVNPALSYASLNVVSPQLSSVEESRVSPFLQPKLRASDNYLDLIRLTPPLESHTETLDIHDKKGDKTGESVSYDPNNPSSLWNAAEELMKSDNPEDRRKAMELLFKFQEIQQFEIQKASILHDLAMSAIKAMRG